MYQCFQREVDTERKNVEGKNMEDILGISGTKTACIQVGHHCITFVDTSTAWQQLLESTKCKLRDDSTFNNSNCFTKLQTFTNPETESAHDMPEYAFYRQKDLLPRKEWICSICKKGIEPADMRDKVDCRVCRDMFHLKCVRRHGLCNDTVCMQYDPSVGWSCHDCDNVFGLLRDEEQEEISDLYDKIAGEDKVIDMDEYIDQRKKEYRNLLNAEMTSGRLEQEKEMFFDIDQDNSGFIERWEFYPYMAIRYLSHRKSLEIVNMLTPYEVDKFRSYFREKDTNSQGSIMQADARQAYVKWYLSNVNSREDKYVDYTWYGGPKENTLLKILKSKMALTSSFQGDVEEQNAIMITWEQFLRICSLHVLSARINNMSNRPKIPPMPLYLYSHSSCLCYLEEQI